MASWLIAHAASASTASQPSAPDRFSWRMWTLVLASVLIVHYCMFFLVHNLVDMRTCTLHLPDPLYRHIPFNPRWTTFVDNYLVVAAAILIALLAQALRGRQFPLLRVATALAIQSTLRCITLLTIPACRVNIPIGTPGSVHPMTVTLENFYTLGFHGFAINDLVFSGHIGFFLLFLYATPGWPRSVRAAIAFFTILLAYGLLATREHYTIDLLLAIPCSFFADRMALTLLHCTPADHA